MTLQELSFSQQGNPYIAGWQDCYSAVQSLYKAFADINLKDYARPNNWFLIPEFNFFDRLHEEEGFIYVGENSSNVMTGDIIVMNIGRTINNNHVAVYVGGGNIFHHLQGERSRCEAYGPKWRNRARYILRHPELIKHMSLNQKVVLTHVNQLIKKRTQGYL